MEQLTQFAPFLLMFVVIYFFMIKPQQKKAKQEKQFESALKVGDKIITKSGLHGKVAELAETTFGDNFVSHFQSAFKLFFLLCFFLLWFDHKEIDHHKH